MIDDSARVLWHSTMCTDTSQLDHNQQRWWNLADICHMHTTTEGPVVSIADVERDCAGSHRHEAAYLVAGAADSGSYELPAAASAFRRGLVASGARGAARQPCTPSTGTAQWDLEPRRTDCKVPAYAWVACMWLLMVAIMKGGYRSQSVSQMLFLNQMPRKGW